MDKAEIEKKTELVKKIPSPYDLHANDNSGNLIRGRNGGFRANAMQVNGETNGTNENALSGLRSEQWKTLKDLLNNHKGTTSDKMTGKHSEWIIDTGASSHMTGNLSLLCGLRDVIGCPVRLPDGKQLMANKEGTVTLDGGLKVENDCTSKMLIGVGEQRDGLYFFKGIRSEKAHKANGTCELNLWHQRMGHPSFKVTKLASNMRCDSDILKNKPCDNSLFLWCFIFFDNNG
ncbi:uncharacterized protein LOC114915233 [Cajanus cajan]|uniref:uncharacterized protein LOC114915233 n=1 Tax=Cajanus cajan TaxID=3821 RepID=UPI0010FAF470|nr:uncharacterized protein LOC114915233 [Cajanus cajan]